MKIRTPTRLVKITLYFGGIFVDICDFDFGRIVDTSDGYIKVSIVHPKMHFFFLLFMYM